MPLRTSSQPYLSVVVTSRNDNHGGDLVLRMQTFLDAFVTLCVKYRLTTEVIFVEWNPPSDHPRLADALRWPESYGYCQYRIIEVPPELHATLDCSDRLPLYQMIAKNVGIRRARGRYVLATNVDLIFSDRIMRWLSRRSLQPGMSYRIDRYDVPLDVMSVPGLRQQLTYCSKNLLRVHVAHGTVTGEDWNRYANLRRFSPVLASLVISWPQICATRNLGQILLDIWLVWWASVQLAWQNHWSRFTGFVNQVWSGAKRIVTDARDGVVRRVNSVVYKVRQAANRVASGVNRVASAGARVVSAVSRAWSKTCTGVAAFTDRCVSKARRTLASVVGRVESLAARTCSLAGSFARRAWSVPVRLMQRFVRDCGRLARTDWSYYAGRFAHHVANGNWHILGKHLRWHVAKLVRKLQKVAIWFLRLGRSVSQGVTRPRTVRTWYIWRFPSALISLARRGVRYILRRSLQFASRIPLFVARSVRLALRSVRLVARYVRLGIAGGRKLLNMVANMVTTMVTSVASIVTNTLLAPFRFGLKCLNIGINCFLACMQAWLTFCQLEWMPDFTAFSQAFGVLLGTIRYLVSTWLKRANRLHTNACGDFTLMSREDWLRLGGYAEFPMYSWHIDSLFLYAADAAGIKEKVVPYPVYHIEHGGGWSPESCDLLFGRLRQRNIPFLTNEDLAMLDQRIRSMKGVCQLTGPDWGFGHTPLPDVEIEPDMARISVKRLKKRTSLAA